MRRATLRPLTEDEIARAASVTAADRARVQHQLERDSPLLAALVVADDVKKKGDDR